MKTPLILLLFFATFFPVYSQVDFTPYAGNSSHCPGEYKTFTASVGSGCGPVTWVITNGKIRNPSTNAEVTTITGPMAEVKWNDIVGSGKLRATVTCGAGENAEVVFEEKTFIIRSLTGRTPSNIQKSQTLQYCSSNTFSVSVDYMYLENTGGASGIPQEDADGYEWLVPAGWKAGGQSGIIETSTPQISITPDDGCKGGSISVRAFMICGTKKYSNPASISLDRPFITSLPKPSNYTAPQCGNKTPVTFTADYFPCAQTYRWTFSRFSGCY